MKKCWLGTRRSRSRRSSAITSFLAALTVAAVLAGCGSSNNSGAQSGSGPTGTVTGTITSAPYATDFNPFSPGNIAAVSNGMIYEPLMFFDTAQAGNVQPWLATRYTWGTGGKSVTFTLRHNVAWNDGKPFTSADVAYTFNLDKNPSLNSFGLPIASAVTDGPYSVTLNFTQSVYTDLYYIAGKTMIVPQHIWSTISNPTTWTDPNPVGTGAYVVSKINPQVLTLTANPHYYMPGLPKVKTYEYVVYSGNNTSDAAIASGQLDWAGNFIPNVNRTYLAKNPEYHLVDIPLAVDYLIPNMVKGPTTSLALRQAVSAALDRNYMSQAVYNGYAPATNPEGLLMPNFKNVASPQTRTDAFPGANPAQAKSILEAAGYKLGKNGMFSTPGGQPLSVDIKVVSGYTDYLSLLQIMQPELKAAGISVTITEEASSVWTTDQDTGNFQFLISNAGYTPIPYTFYYNLLSSGVTKPLGTSQGVSGNFGRYHNPTVDSLLNQIASTTDTATQNQAFAQIESIFKQQLPDIPLMEAQDEIEFNGNAVTNFPTASSPWAGAAIWLNPDDGWVAARLTPVK